MRYFILIGMFIVFPFSIFAQNASTPMKKAIEEIQSMHQVYFVYDSSLDQIKPAGEPLKGKKLEDNLRTVFSKTGICWEISNGYVLLTLQRNYTLSGFVCENNGQPLTNVNVYDLQTQRGTLTDEKGHFKLMLPEGNHALRFSYIGYKRVKKDFELNGDYQVTIYMKESTTSLDEVKVVAKSAEETLQSAEMGKVSFSGNRIKSIPVLLGEPDVIKTLHTLPGVTQGMDGFTGLYVHGGENDQNLFLYEGLPLYHVDHLGGVFSSFNASTIGKVDFYKTTFPSRYGGRLSSVTDISMKQPDFGKLSGTFSIGLLSGNLYLSAPIRKDKTALAIGIRHSWLDVLMLPTMAIVNACSKSNGEKHTAYYGFTDLNLRLDHRFNSNLTAGIVGYLGKDRLKIGERLFEMEGRYNNLNEPSVSMEHEYFDEDLNKLNWGNWGVLGYLNYRANKGNIKVQAYYSDYQSSFSQEYKVQRNVEDFYSSTMYRTQNAIKDGAVQASFVSDFNDVYQLETGAGWIHHNYVPEDILNQSATGSGMIYEARNHDSVKANEVFCYVDNKINLTDNLSVNAGLRSAFFHVDGVSQKILEPRVSFRAKLTKKLLLKAGYARMNQFAQQISNNYINLPTDLWQPVTSRFKPLQSDQYSLGTYLKLPYSLTLSVEGWYKKMRNILEYKEGVSVYNPTLNWQDKLTAGKGHSYGVDISLARTLGPLTGTIGYGLMWNKRKFDELNEGEEFNAKFDNRHKININANYKLNDKIELNAGWTYMTGNRITLALYSYETPENQFPDAPHINNPSTDGVLGLDYFSGRNNVRMPAYHRLDLGVRLHKMTKKGRHTYWNIGLYNAYCRMNPMTIKKEMVTSTSYEQKRTFKTMSLLPIIPSVSYTYKF